MMAASSRACRRPQPDAAEEEGGEGACRDEPTAEGEGRCRIGIRREGRVGGHGHHRSFSAVAAGLGQSSPVFVFVSRSGSGSGRVTGGRIAAASARVSDRLASGMVVDRVGSAGR